MKQSFIISIFLLILCIIISQVAHYYLQQTIVEGNTNTPASGSPAVPTFITKYMSDILNNSYLNNTHINNIKTSAIFANTIKPVTNKGELIVYLKVLQTQLNATNSPPLPQLTFFCISIPAAFKLFYLPPPNIPIPYNKLHATMPDIFPTSVPYTQIQTICILWQQTMLLFSPKGPIIDPRNDTFNEIINGYISQINNAIIVYP